MEGWLKMKTYVSEHEFVKAFDDYDRSNNFSVAGRRALFDYFEGYEESTNEEIDLDVIAICCEYTEYENLKEFHADYNKDHYETIDDIENQTTVIRIDDESFIIVSF